MNDKNILNIIKERYKNRISIKCGDCGKGWNQCQSASIFVKELDGILEKEDIEKKNFYNASIEFCEAEQKKKNDEKTQDRLGTVCVQYLDKLCNLEIERRRKIKEPYNQTLLWLKNEYPTKLFNDHLYTTNPLRPQSNEETKVYLNYLIEALLIEEKVITLESYKLYFKDKVDVSPIPKELIASHISDIEQYYFIPKKDLINYRWVENKNSPKRSARIKGYDDCIDGLQLKDGIASQYNIFHMHDYIYLSDYIQGYEMARIKGFLINVKNNQANNLRKDQESKHLQDIKIETIFESISKYKYIMELLVTKNLVNSHTYITIDEDGGNKSLFIAIIKNLHGKGYYKDNVKPTNKEIVDICKNSFGLAVSIDTVKKTKATSHDLEFIPIASTIK